MNSSISPSTVAAALKQNLFRRFWFAASRAIYGYVIEPRRMQAYDRRREPFVYKNTQGLYFKLHPGEYVDRQIATYGLYERPFIQFIQGILPRGAVMLDIGANIGNHAIALASCCSEIHCFEPNPTAIERLKENIALNRTDQVIVHEYGLGGQDAVLPFYENKEGNLGRSGFVGGAQGVAQRFLPIRAADAAVATLNLSRIDFIKIDVEGMEGEVLSSLVKTIARYRPFIMFEHHEQQVERGTFERIRTALPNYTIKEPVFIPRDAGLAKRALWRIRYGEAPELQDVSEPEPRTYENLLAIPCERAVRSQKMKRRRARRMWHFPKRTLLQERPDGGERGERG